MCSIFFMTQKSVCFAETTGTVTAETYRVRQETSMDSTVVGSTASNGYDTDEVTDSSGTIWYEVIVDANTRDISVLI